MGYIYMSCLCLDSRLCIRETLAFLVDMSISLKTCRDRLIILFFDVMVQSQLPIDDSSKQMNLPANCVDTALGDRSI
ncbi:hypothetical protein VNO77_16303 [Canavalia gladiata]|uniref:Uncharacterized protein n=1 Tax=Canavalia gladiata TaxID=3824 RepID=A0AAN9QWH1_CANGL